MKSHLIEQMVVGMVHVVYGILYAMKHFQEIALSEATTIKDSYTREFAMCLQDTLSTIPLSPNYPTNYKTPHLIINELHRSKLDPNREIEQAAQNNTYAENTWHKIHYQWMAMA